MTRNKAAVMDAGRSCQLHQETGPRNGKEAKSGFGGLANEEPLEVPSQLFHSAEDASHSLSPLGSDECTSSDPLYPVVGRLKRWGLSSNCGFLSHGY